MKTALGCALALGLTCFAPELPGQAPEQAYFSVPGVDAPELAARGKYGVGVRTVEIVHKAQVDIVHFDKTTGKAPAYDRPLTVEVWYPAVIPAGQAETTVYESPMAGRAARAEVPATFSIPGKALRDAAPVAGERFPLVIVSHGYPGSRTFLSYLTENLASKGYVVAAIDHTDSVFGAVRDFSSTLLNRSNDQRFTMQALAERAAKPGDFLSGLVDASRVALVGYSMGGYGALATAGALYRKDSMASKIVPGGYFSPATAASLEDGSPGVKLRAVVAIAPWGNQPPYRMWDKAGLKGIAIPSLFIAGDQDDVSDYRAGILPAFEQAESSERCLLVYENARHNVGGNPPPAGVPLDFEALGSFEEPAWRKDRITAINQHFITAFLDFYVKGDQSRADYLHVSPEKSNEGEWPLKQGDSAEAVFSTGSTDGKQYWKGFQRRWAVGLEMRCLKGLPASGGQAGR